MCRRLFAVLAMGALIFPGKLPADSILSVPFTAGAPGATALVPVNYTTDTNAPSLQFDLLYDTNFLAAGSPIGGNALSDHQIASAEVSPGLRRVLILSLSNSPITNGVLVYVPFAISTNAPDHDELLTMSNVLVVNAAAQTTPSESSNGVLAVAVPPRFTAIFPTNGGAVHLELAGTTGRRYAIQGATNLSQPVWRAIDTNAAAGGLAEFDDGMTSAAPARYYRAAVVP